jgi:hypothetical protein
LKDNSRVCPCKYRGLIAKGPYKTSKFQRLSAIVTGPTAWRYSHSHYRAHTLKSHDFMPQYSYRLAFIYQNQTNDRGELCHYTTKIEKPVFDPLREICQIPFFVIVVGGCITRTNRNRKRLMNLLSRALGLVRTLRFSMMASITCLCDML